MLSNNYFEPASKKVELSALAMHQMPPEAKAKYMRLISGGNNANTILTEEWEPGCNGSSAIYILISLDLLQEERLQLCRASYS